MSEYITGFRTKDGIKQIDYASIANRIDGLIYEGNYLYLTANGEVVSDGVEVQGGGDGSSTVVRLRNDGSGAIASATKTPIWLKFTFTSTEDGIPTTGECTAQIIVNGVIKYTTNIKQGPNEIDIQDLVPTGESEVKLVCTDPYGTQRSLKYTVNVIVLSISSNFDDTIRYYSNINFPFTVDGLIEKTVHFKLDGNEIDTMVIKTSNKSESFYLPMLTHGSHDFEVYATATINGVSLPSNKLVYDIMFVEESNLDIIVASPFDTKEATEGDLLVIPFSVYDPSNLTADVVLTITDADGEVYFKQQRTVDRTRQTWNVRQYPSGSVTFTISCGTKFASHTVQVTESVINAKAETEGLTLFLTSNNRSNDEEDPAVWTYNDVTTTFENVNWVDTGWINDENGDTALRLSGSARATINIAPFSTDARSYGKTIELEYAIRDVNNRDAVAISCISDGIGFEVTADHAFMAGEASRVGCHYTEEERIRVSFVIEPKSAYKLLSVYLNGVLSGVTQYVDGDNFQQVNVSNISLGSSYCSVDIYNIRVYDCALKASQIRDNYIADMADINLKKKLDEDNNIYASGELSYNKLVEKIPVLIITGVLPTYKGDKKSVTVQYIDMDNPELNFTDTAQIDVQGTSSKDYIRKNWKIKTSTPHILDFNQIPTKVLCWKVDYAESTGTHNTGNANYVDLFYEHIQTHPDGIDANARTTIYGRPCVIFNQVDSTSELVFYGKSNANVDKGGLEVFGFDQDEDVQSVEFCNNDKLACKFHAPISEDWSEEFEFRHPDKHDDISAFKVMHDWVVSTWQEGATNELLEEEYVGVDGTTYTNDTAAYRLAKFKKEFTEHFDFEMSLVYYLYTFVMLMTDQRAKNMFLTSWDLQIWEPWLYDNDKYCRCKTFSDIRQKSRDGQCLGRL